MAVAKCIRISIIHLDTYSLLALELLSTTLPRMEFYSGSKAVSMSPKASPFSGLSLAGSPPSKISLGSGLKLAASAQLKQRGAGLDSSQANTASSKGKQVKKLTIKNAKGAVDWFETASWAIGDNERAAGLTDVNSAMQLQRRVPRRRSAAQTSPIIRSRRWSEPPERSSPHLQNLSPNHSKLFTRCAKASSVQAAHQVELIWLRRCTTAYGSKSSARSARVATP